VLASHWYRSLAFFLDLVASVKLPLSLRQRDSQSPRANSKPEVPK